MQSSKENLLKFNGHKIASHSRMRMISDQISWQFNDGKVGLSLIATNGYLFINKYVIKLQLQHNYVTSNPLMLYILNVLIKFCQAEKFIQIHCICLKSATKTRISHGNNSLPLTVSSLSLNFLTLIS